MNKIFFSFLFILIVCNAIFATDIKVFNDTEHGFQMVTSSGNIQIDENPRDFIEHKITRKNNMILIECFTRSVVPQSDIIIIKNHKVSFDSKIILYGRPYTLMKDIYTNYYYLLKSKRFEMPPELCNFDPYNPNTLSINILTHKTLFVGNKIIINVNFEANYRKYLRVVFDTDGKPLSFDNKTGIIADTNHAIATINDPDGYTNVRSGPGTNNYIIEKIHDNEVFSLINITANWIKIKTPSGKFGYIHKSRVKHIPSRTIF